MKHIVVDNFFSQFNFIKNEFKKIKRYNLEEFNKLTNEKQNWPGQRSDYVSSVEPFLFNLFLLEFKKFDFDLSYHKISMFTHLRLSEDKNKDWIHKDIEHDYTCIVYLSETSLNSGTFLYSENKEIISDIKFIQNRAFLFNGNYNHSAYGHHGTDEENGRLTLNVFIKKLKF